MHWYLVVYCFEIVSSLLFCLVFSPWHQITWIMPQTCQCPNCLWNVFFFLLFLLQTNTYHHYFTQCQCSCKLIFCATNLSPYTFSVFRLILSQIHHSVYPSMHAVSHSLTQCAHWALPATWTCAHWQPYSTIQSLSAHPSPAGYLHTPASSVPSAFPTPQAIRSQFSLTGMLLSFKSQVPVNTT